MSLATETVLRPALALRLFGGFEALRGGTPLPRPRTRTEQWLLAFLVLRAGRPLDRGTLAGVFWPDSSEEQALNNLRRSLSNLRTVLGPDACRLRTPRSRSIGFDVSGLDVDVLRFDAAVRGDGASLRRAVEWYVGPLLEGCPAEWVLPERRRREEAYLQALQRLAEEAAARNDPATAGEYLRRAAAADPFSESLLRRRMEMLAAAGEYAALTQAFRDYRLLLGRELRSLPGEETAALYRRLRAQGRAAAGGDRRSVPSGAGAVAPRSLPRPLSTLVGREEEARAVAGCLEVARLVTLTGIGGVGKTRLALRVAEEVAEEYQDGVWFVDLATTHDPDLAPRVVSAALGLREPPGEPARTGLEGLTAHLQRKRLLLLLDNCEHLTVAVARLAHALLSACPGVQVLATSREGLGIGGELTYCVPPLSLPDPAAGSEALLRSDSARLFLDRAALLLSGFRVTDRESAALAQICAQLDGLPLALELAAARLRSMSLQEIAERLDQRFTLLTGGDRLASPRHQTLRSAMDWSYGLLTESERTVLRRLSVFSRGCGLEAAEEVCGGSGIAPGDVVSVLAALVEKSLVLHEEQEGRARYRLLETVRRYCVDRLRESGEEERLRIRHRECFLALAEEAKPRLFGREQVAWQRRLRAEEDNLRAALDGCARDPAGGKAGLRLAAALDRFWRDQGSLSEGRQHCAAALAHPGASRPTAARAAALLGAGSLASVQADFPAARRLFQEALAIAREIGDRSHLAITLGRLGDVTHALGDMEGAVPLLEEALALHQELGQSWYASQASVVLGNLAMSCGDWDRAQSRYEQSLAGWQDLGDRRYAYVLDNLGLLAAYRGDEQAARRLHEQALAVNRESGDKWGMATSLLHLGHAAQRSGDFPVARGLLGESLSLWQEIGDSRRVAEAGEALAASRASGEASVRRP